MIRNIGGDKIEKKKKVWKKKMTTYIHNTEKTVYAYLFLTLYLFSIHDFHFCRVFWYSLSPQLSHQLTSVLKFVNLFRHSSLLPLLDSICDEISIDYFPIAHNTLCLPPKFCITYCLKMLLGKCNTPRSI